MDSEFANKISMTWKRIPNCDWFCIDVEKADVWFRNSGSRYIGRNDPGEILSNGISKRERFEKFALEHAPEEILSSFIIIAPEPKECPRIYFRGRHRFCVLRDAGVRKMMISALHPGYAIAWRNGLAIR